MAETVKQWLLKQRIQNYGYDYPFWRKMSAHKTRLKQKVSYMSDAEIRKELAKAGILGKGKRLTRGRKGVDYTTGQSFNEELINMLQLSATKGKKSFWETQERWI